MFSRLLLLAAAALPGRADAPPAPAVYDVVLRYQIHAFRNEHVKQYFEMMRYLKDVGFVRAEDDVPPDDEPESNDYDTMRGTIAADKAPLLLDDRHVRVVQLTPRGKALPADANALVRVDLTLAAGFPPERQRTLPDQVAAAIADLKFREAVAYDRRGGARLLGAVPVGQPRRCSATCGPDPAPRTQRRFNRRGRSAW